MITPDEYPVYNHRERPGIGRDANGDTYFNCFSIRLQRDQAGHLLPYTFRDFVQQYTSYGDHSGTCQSCIARHRTLTFRVGDDCCDLSAVDRKFIDEDVDEADYYYCPLIGQVLSSSELTADAVGAKRDGLPAQPMRAILFANWDDDYLFKFERVGSPGQPGVCAVYQRLQSGDFVGTRAERSFLSMWFLAMFRLMEAVRASERPVYLEPQDFSERHSRLLDFVLPVPQVWVRVVPKPPPGRDWHEWENLQGAGSQPQRVDFLVVGPGSRHAVELDDKRHYAIRSPTGQWLASEERYSQTLAHSRLLERSGFEVHRFSNQEVLTLAGDPASSERDLSGFVDLLRSEGLFLEWMVFAHQAE